MGRASNSRKFKVIDSMIKNDLNAWSILYRIAYFVPLSQLERAYLEAVAQNCGMTYIGNQTDVVRLSYASEAKGN